MDVGYDKFGSIGFLSGFWSDRNVSSPSFLLLGTKSWSLTQQNIYLAWTKKKKKKKLCQRPKGNPTQFVIRRLRAAALQ